MTGIYVLTSPRRGNVEPYAYLLSTLEQLELEGLPPGPRHLMLDGALQDEDNLRLLLEARPVGSWEIHRHNHGANWLGGNKWPYWALLEVARDTTGLHDDALVLEDDLELCVNAARRMLLLEVPPDVDWLQYFSAWLFTAPRAHPGLWRTPALVQGCQALKFPRRTLERLCTWAEEDPEWQKYHESDVALGLAQQRLGLRCANHMPDLVQHAGEASLVSHAMNVEAGIDDPEHVALSDRSLKGRVSVNYSKSFDAMKLFARHELYR